MSTRAKLLAALGIVALVITAIIATMLLWPSSDPNSAAPSASRTSDSGPTNSDPAPVSDAGGSGASTDPSSPEAVLKQFATIYANPRLDTDEWIKQLAPYSSSAMLVSLKTTDRDVAAASGATILETTDRTATVGPGTNGYTLTYEMLPTDDEGTSLASKITGIDYLTPQPGKALPVTSQQTEQLRPQLNKAAIAVIGLPGGTTDAARADTIQVTFTDPTLALATPRTGSEAVSIRIGNLRSIELMASEDGRLMATAVVPYAPDGSNDPKWATLIVYLTRNPDGTWALQDATY